MAAHVTLDGIDDEGTFRDAAGFPAHLSWRGTRISELDREELVRVATAALREVDRLVAAENERRRDSMHRAFERAGFHLNPLIVGVPASKAT